MRSMGAEEDWSLREFVEHDGDLSTIPNLEGIVSAIVLYYGDETAYDLVGEATHQEEAASILERGAVYQERIWNHDHWLVVEEYPPTTDNVRRARWLSEALRDRVLANRLLERVSPSMMADIHEQLAPWLKPGDTP
jgi:hypothetical protein